MFLPHNTTFHEKARRPKQAPSLTQINHTFVKHVIFFNLSFLSRMDGLRQPWRVCCAPGAALSSPPPPPPLFLFFPSCVSLFLNAGLCLPVCPDTGHTLRYLCQERLALARSLGLLRCSQRTRQFSLSLSLCVCRISPCLLSPFPLEHSLRLGILDAVWAADPYLHGRLFHVGDLPSSHAGIRAF